MKKIVSYGLMILAVFGIIFSVSSVFAYKGDITQMGPNGDEERYEAMQMAFEDTDYETWNNLMIQNSGNSRMMDRVNADNFDTFIQLREAKLAGDLDRVNELKTELGFEQGFGNGRYEHGQGRGMSNSQRGLAQGNCPYMD